VKNIPEVTSVKACADFILAVTFGNGEVRQFDVRPYLERGIFVRLKDVNLFKRAYVEHGTVAWPGGLDIAPETLYLKSKNLEERVARMK
jgi:hypothetical protein